MPGSSRGPKVHNVYSVPLRPIKAPLIMARNLRSRGGHILRRLLHNTVQRGIEYTLPARVGEISGHGWIEITYYRHRSWPNYTCHSRSITLDYSVSPFWLQKNGKRIRTDATQFSKTNDFMKHGKTLLRLFRLQTTPSCYEWMSSEASCRPEVLKDRNHPDRDRPLWGPHRVYRGHQGYDIT